MKMIRASDSQDETDARREKPLASRNRNVERRDLASRRRVVERVLAEFREMPCLRLTAAQAQRLFGLRSDISARVIEELIRDGHLRRGADGRYATRSVS
jgi:hypothetical protein